MKYYLLRFNEDWADEYDVPALAGMKEKEFEDWKQRKLSIYAHLGNWGDGFMEDFQGITGNELVKSKIVQKFEVDENFHKIFHKADLASLSLSNIFDKDNEYEEEDEDDEFELDGEDREL